MIPLRDNVRARGYPWTNLLLILANFAVFFYQLSLGGQTETFVRTYGLIPARFVSDGSVQATVIPLFTSMFIHGGLLHILGNMLFLYVFGDNVEDRMGHLGYLAFYLLCGVAAALGQIYSFPTATAPMVGASGAIAGVLAGYLVLYPRARVATLIPILLFFPIVELPAWVFLGYWFVIQLVSGVEVLSVARQVNSGVAFWAHIGGFAAGFILVFFFRRKQTPDYHDLMNRGRWIYPR